jgi:tRNA pseudouridine38-40 synthase
MASPVENPPSVPADDRIAAMSTDRRTVRLLLAYEGTRYSGWQVQPGRQTVQGTLAAAIRSISGEVVCPRGSSRTDAGVHAMGQVAAFETTASLEPGRWRAALNARLPDDIAVLEAREVSAGFDPVAAARSKRYRYRIHDGPYRPVFDRRLVWQWRSALDVTRMADAARHLVGEHDFTSFETTPSRRLSRVRTIHALSVARFGGPIGPPEARETTPAADETGLSGPEVWIEVEGNGFLHNMVRIIVGTLVTVGSGRRPASWVEEALAARSRPAAGPTAPPQGLALLWIRLHDEPGAAEDAAPKDGMAGGRPDRS